MKKIKLFFFCLFLISTTNSQTWPIKGTSAVNADVITSPFGPRQRSFGYQLHWGIDIRAGVGTYVYAVKGGKIKQLGNIGNDIIAVRINHYDGTATEYLHLDSDPCISTDPLLAAIINGSDVVEGQLIAFSGESGAVGSPHLHLSYFPDNSKTSSRLYAYNPMDILVHYVTDDYIFLNGYWIKDGGDGGLSDQICIEVNVDPRRIDLNKIEIALSDVLDVNGNSLSEEDILTSTEYETNEIGIIDFNERSNIDYGPRNPDDSSDPEFNGVEIDVLNYDNSEQGNYHTYRFKFNCRSNALSNIRGEIGEIVVEASNNDSYSVSTTPTNIPVQWWEFWPYNTYDSGWPASITIGNYGKVFIQNSNVTFDVHVAASTEMIVENGGMLELEDGINTGSRTWFTLRSPLIGSYKRSAQSGGISDLATGLGSSSITSLNATASSGNNLWVKSGGTLKLGNYARLENYGKIQLDGTSIISPTDAKIDNYIKISGTVSSSSGITLTDALIIASGNPTISTSSDTYGNFTLYVSSGWTGTVTASLAGYIFNPINHTSPLTSDVSGQNFTGTPVSIQTITISGTVQMLDNSSPVGVIVSANGTANGNPSNASNTILSGINYSLTVASPWTGTVTALRAGYSFNLINHTNPVTSNITGENFTGTPQTGPTYTIQGYITSDGTSTGSPISSVTLNITDLYDNVISSSVVSSPYTISVASNWTGKITLSKSGYSFDPIYLSYFTPLTVNLTNQNFKGIQNPASGASIYNISVSPTVIPLGQTSVATMITFSVKFKWPPGICYAANNQAYSDNMLWISIDHGGSKGLRPLGEGVYTYPATFNLGPHSVYIELIESNNGECPVKTAVKTCSTSTFTFNIVNTPPPLPPTLKTPSDGAINIATTSTFEWNPSATATEYILNVFSDPLLERGVYDPSTTGTTIPVGPLLCKNTYWWRVKAINSSGHSAWSQVFSFATVPAIVSGTVTYGNTAANPIGNVNVTLTPATGTALTATSSTTNGTFNILNVPNGQYTLTAAKTNNWGGVDIADALAAVQYFVLTLTDLGTLGREAGDVDKSNAVNSTDAFLIARRSIGNTTPFPAGNWVFTGAQPISVSNENIMNRTIRGRTVGDVDGSYTQLLPPGATFQKSFLVQLKSGTEKFTVSAPTSASCGAVGMRIKVTSAKVASISSKLPGFMSNIDNEGVSFGWFAADGITPVQFEANEAIVTVVLTEKVGDGSSVTVESKLVDIQRTELNNNLSVSVQVNIPLVFELKQNYPNPFNPSTQINYDLPQSGMVTLTIYNMLGQEVVKLVNEQKDAGSYSVQWTPKNLASGMYIYRIRIKTEKETIMAVKRLMLLK